jgi:hypothetical protein
MTKVQLCPRCNGQGHTWTPPWLPGDQHTWVTSKLESYKCPPCNGTGLLFLPDALITEQKRSQRMREALENIVACGWDCAAPGQTCQDRARAGLKEALSETIPVE